MNAAVSQERSDHVVDVLAAAPAAIDRMAWEPDVMRAWQQTRLRSLLAVAIERSAFHAERLAGIDPGSFTLDRLADVPVMTKSEMMARYDDVVTDRRLTRLLVDRHVAAAPVGMSYLLGRYVVMASGGSSGERGVFAYQAAEFTEFTLSLVRGTLATLTAFGVGPDNPVPGVLVAAPSTIHGTGAVGALVGGPGAPVAMTTVSATRPIDDIVVELMRVQPLVLVGYPSVLARLAVEQAAGRLSIAPLAVGSTSELLTAQARQSIEAAFGVPMTDTFGSTEGLCGVSLPGDPAIAFATDSCIVELVDDDLRPVPPGTPSSKVLLTNLYNHTQPLIRYELTDRFVAVAGDHPDGRLRATVDGRQDPPLRYRLPGGDVDLHPLVVRAVLVKVAEVLEHQVVQTPTGIDVRVVAADGFDPGPLVSPLSAALGAAGLRDADVVVHVVDAIERDALTGKPRRFVPVDAGLVG